MTLKLFYKSERFKLRNTENNERTSNTIYITDFIYQ